MRADTARTVSVESTRPAKDSVQKGVTWRSTDRCEWSNQTQRRFSSNEGTVPDRVASTLANTALTPKSPTRTPSTIRLVTVRDAGHGGIAQELRNRGRVAQPAANS